MRAAVAWSPTQTHGTLCAWIQHISIKNVVSSLILRDFHPNPRWKKKPKKAKLLINFNSDFFKPLLPVPPSLGLPHMVKEEDWKAEKHSLIHIDINWDLLFFYRFIISNSYWDLRASHQLHLGSSHWRIPCCSWLSPQTTVEPHLWLCNSALWNCPLCIIWHYLTWLTASVCSGEL